MRAIFGIILCLPFIGWASSRIYRDVKFNQECAGYLENAAHANQVKDALPEMENALKYMRDHRMTEGYTSIIYNTQDENVGFWYKNLEAATQELRVEAKNEKMSPLEQSNVLLKLHETLKREPPSGIEIAPNNSGYCWFGCLSFVVAIVGGILIAYQFT
jgi:hypothetical protein